MSIWSENDLEYLKNNYENSTKHEIAKALGKTENAIQLKANRMGLKKKSKYHYDKLFFRNIDTQKKSYWLGFMYADGYVTKAKDSINTYSLGIELSVIDKNHLKNFNIDISGNVDITYRHRESKYNNKIISGDTCSIRLYCSSMAKDLINHGCCLNKSSVKDAPIGVPEYLMSSFIRGYFDGNGTLFYASNKNTKNKYLRVIIETGSENFAKWMSSYLDNIGYETFVCKDKKAFKIYVKSAFCVDFLKYIYSDSERHLKRKYDKYIIAVCGDDADSTNYDGAKSVKA